jgi:uncharacterized membrane protein
VRPTWLILAVVSIAALGVWGFLSKIALRHLDWDVVALLYYAVSLAGMLVVYRLARVPDAWTPRVVATAVLSGLTGTLVCFYLALDRQKASLVVPLIAGTYPVVTAVLSAAFLRERLSPAGLAGIGFAIGAVVLISVG